MEGNYSILSSSGSVTIKDQRGSCCLPDSKIKSCHGVDGAQNVHFIQYPRPGRINQTRCAPVQSYGEVRCWCRVVDESCRRGSRLPAAFYHGLGNFQPHPQCSAFLRILCYQSTLIYTTSFRHNKSSTFEFEMATASSSAIGKVSREEFRRQKDLDAARKAGNAPAEVDEDGNAINPHIPRQSLISLVFVFCLHLLTSNHDFELFLFWVWTFYRVYGPSTLVHEHRCSITQASEGKGVQRRPRQAQRTGSSRNQSLVMLSLRNPLPCIQNPTIPLWITSPTSGSFLFLQ